MSISDRLDQIARESVEADEQWDCGRSAFNADNHAPPIDAALVNGEHMLAALRAVLDLCELIEKAHAANPERTYEQGMEVAAHKVRTVIAAALGQEDSHASQRPVPGPQPRRVAQSPQRVARATHPRRLHQPRHPRREGGSRLGTTTRTRTHREGHTMTGMEHAIEQAADVIANALHDKADVDLFGGYTDTNDLNDSVLDSRYSLIAVARALADAGLLAPAPLREEVGYMEPCGEVWSAELPGEDTRVRRYVTEWEEA